MVPCLGMKHYIGCYRLFAFANCQVSVQYANSTRILFELQIMRRSNLTRTFPTITTLLPP
jgi:hypothetical protein